MLTDSQFTRYMEMHKDTVFRVALNYLRNPADADDVTQSVFLRLYRASPSFEHDDHAKFWLIRVTSNECKRLLLSPWRRIEPLDEYREVFSFPSTEHAELMDAVMRLPAKYRVAIYLHYYENLSTAEIAKVLLIPRSTVLTHLRRGREALKQQLTEGWNHA